MHFVVIALVIGVIVLIGLLAERLDVQSWPLVWIGSAGLGARIPEGPLPWYVVGGAARSGKRLQQGRRPRYRAGRAVLSALLISAALAGCGSSTDPPPVAAANAVPVAPPAPSGVPEVATALVREAVTAAESAAPAGTEPGVAVLDRVSGELAVGARGDEPFYTASLSKLLVAVDVLYRHRVEGVAVDASDLDLIRRALGPSDDQAMNVLWVRFDGPGAVSRVATRLGLSSAAPPPTPSQWGDVALSPRDTARLLDHVLGSLPPQDREIVVGALAQPPAIAADGFDQSFGLLAPQLADEMRGDVLAKQGWMCCHSGRRHLHTAGAVGADQRYVVVVLSRVPRSSDWDSARAGSTASALAAVRALV